MITIKSLWNKCKDYITEEIKDYGLDIDVVVEAKAKELAVKKYYEKTLTEVL